MLYQIDYLGEKRFEYSRLSSLTTQPVEHVVAYWIHRWNEYCIAEQLR